MKNFRVQLQSHQEARIFITECLRNKITISAKQREILEKTTSFPRIVKGVLATNTILILSKDADTENVINIDDVLPLLLSAEIQPIPEDAVIRIGLSGIGKSNPILAALDLRNIAKIALPRGREIYNDIAAKYPKQIPVAHQELTKGVLKELAAKSGCFIINTGDENIDPGFVLIPGNWYKGVTYEGDSIICKVKNIGDGLVHTERGLIRKGVYKDNSYTLEEACFANCEDAVKEDYENILPLTHPEAAFIKANQLIRDKYYICAHTNTDIYIFHNDERIIPYTKITGSGKSNGFPIGRDKKFRLATEEQIDLLLANMYFPGSTSPLRLQALMTPTVGDLCWVKNGDEWKVRYFSHKEGNVFHCFHKQENRQGGTGQWEKCLPFWKNPLALKI